MHIYLKSLQKNLPLKYKKFFGFGKYKNEKSIIRRAKTNSTN